MTKTQFSSERGLALLLVISLLAMVTVLVVSLAVITRVETQINVGSTARAQAKHNALLGLNVALGELQRQAGPDQRVTATAGATQSNTANPHWTGVWRTDGGAGEETWMVSGEGSNPVAALATGRTTIELVQPAEGAVLNEGQVTVPAELISKSDLPGFTGSWVTGAFAYFVADEGVKASVGPNRSDIVSDTINYGAYANDYAAQRLPFMGGGTAVPFAGIAAIDLAGTNAQAGLANLQSMEQLSLISASIKSNDLQGNWHDYTTSSRGLLVDAERGRLKTDLTTQGATEIPGFGAIEALIDVSRSGAISAVYPIQPQTSGSGEVSNIIAPIVTQVGLQASVHTISATSRTLETRLRFFIELTNPYSSALEAENLRVIVIGLPGNITIESRTNGSDSDHGVGSVNLSSLYSLHTAADGSPAIEFDLPFEDEVWAPGRVYSWRMQSGTTMGEAANRSLVFDASSRTSYWRARPGSSLDGPDSLENSSELRFSGNEDWDITVELQYENGELLGRYELPEFFAVDSAWRDANSTLPDFGIQARFNDRLDAQDADEASDWIRVYGESGLRRAEYDETYWAPAIDLDSSSYTESFSGPNSAVESRQLFNRDPVDRSTLSYYQPGYNSDVPLFELPKQEWHSVGALQHLAFPDEPIYNVGNSWSQRNDWFDRYFFSTMPDLNQVSLVFLNQNLVRIPGDDPLTDSTLRTQSERIPHALWIHGAFNVNSVSAEAWTAVLTGVAGGGVSTDLNFTTHNEETGEVTGENTISIDAPFSRFPSSAGEVFEISPNPSNFQALLRIYRQGVKSLTQAQLEGVGSRIAANVRRRVEANGPFRSLEEFLIADVALFGGDNLLEYSIAEYDASVSESERINWDQYFPNDPIKIDRAAPMYLTSADMMTALAPMVNVRSDTFVIRTYGEVVDPVQESNFEASQPVARAWLEAVVQRYPEGVTVADFVQSDPDDWSQSVAEPTLGRQFRIVSFRWLTEDDI